MIIYVHIPKTAGTTLRNMLEQYSGPDGLYAAYPGNIAGTSSLEAWQTLPEEKKRSIKVLSGHYQVDVFDAAIDVQPKHFITFVRNPIDRVISLYKHSMAVDPNFRGSEISLLKFLLETDESIRVQVSNHQVRMIAGISPLEEITDAHVGCAIERIKRDFLFVGLSEFFQEDVEKLSTKLGVKLDDIGRRNVSPDRRGRQYYSSTEIRAIRSLNTLDFVLYEQLLALRNAPPTNTSLAAT